VYVPEEVEAEPVRELDDAVLGPGVAAEDLAEVAVLLRAAGFAQVDRYTGEVWLAQSMRELNAVKLATTTAEACVVVAVKDCCPDCHSQTTHTDAT
jgi:hypothetical protein